MRGLLSEYQELRVVSENATDASYKLSGSLSPRAGSYRIRAEIVRLQDDETVWSDSYSPDAEVVTTDQLIARNTRWKVIIDEECESIKAKANNLEAAENVCVGLRNNYGTNQGEGYG